jgi:hypothetical protein
VNWFRLKTCIKCQGDLAADNGDWICLQCGAYYYTGLYQLHQKIEDNPPVADPAMPAHPKNKNVQAAATGPLILAAQSPASIPVNNAAMTAAAAV